MLLPARDAEGTLSAALCSLSSQTFADWECILVDDGSRDRTATIAAEHAARDGRIRVVPGPGQGIVAALRTGLACCSASLVARMDADDLCHKRRLEAQVRAMNADPELTAVGCHPRLFPRGALSGGMRAYESWLTSLRSDADVRRDAFVECPIAHPSLMIRTATLRALDYQDRGWPEDYDLVLRMLEVGARVSVVPEVLLLWRESPQRLSRTSASCLHERFVACKAHYLARGPLRGGAEYVLWGFGDTGKELSRALLQEGKRPGMIVELHPGRVGQRIAGAPVVRPEQLQGRRGELPVVVSVAGAQARAEIRRTLALFDFVEGRDFVCAA